MDTHRPLPEDSACDTPAARRTAGLLGIAITLLLLVIGLFPVRHLRAAAAIEDCLMAGRTNCNTLMTVAH
ncbi:hypothetical protein [Rhodopila globiformis]|uniref:Uncharacterized protein n=1 Tax=Rhodopila globiformis TaxID=1071 RepID=A0A2S6NGE4_RHOGL|nr:hypothetical protein [Rhodopila globiformis]PPQ33681.1 hypothetical protein CCS01_13470 [Rhodopila globiformis]